MPTNFDMPKPEGEAVHRNPRVYERLQLEWDGELRGPSLPRLRGITWCRRTKQWWDTWRRSPQSMVMTATDWEVMQEAALIHNALWSLKKSNRNGKITEVPLTAAEMTSLSAELRRKISAYGATFEDRAKLRMSITSPADEMTDEQKIKADAKSAVNYVERLAQEAAKK